MTEIRAVDDANLSQFIEIWNEVFPHPKLTLDELLRDREVIPAHMHPERYLLLRNETPVAVLELGHVLGSFDFMVWQFWLGVAPAERHQGFGRTLYSFAMAKIRSAGWNRIMVRVQEQDPRGITFAQRNGFQELKRDFVSSLDLAPYQPELQEVIGVQIHSFKDLDSPDFRRELHEVFEEIRHDVPRAEPPQPLDFEFFEQVSLNDPLFDPIATQVAIADGVIVGFSGMYRNADNTGDQWLTGVRRSWRGKGLARQLKARVYAQAKASGYTSITTDNDTRNASMLRINDEFGFVRQPWVATFVLRQS